MKTNSLDETFINRCFELALKAGNKTKTNPMVGAVLVYQNEIIGEGYHEYFGGPHAEVNAIENVKLEDKHLIPLSTLYVSLEPCCINSKTPACTNLILQHKIPKVVFSVLDPNPEISGKSIEILMGSDVEVKHGVLRKRGERIISKFKANLKKRPHIIIKFAQSDDLYIGKENQQIQISNKCSNILVHKWRSEMEGILVGTNTAVIDNPKLTNRSYLGSNPVRFILDRTLRIPKEHHLLSDEHISYIITEEDHDSTDLKRYIKMSFEENFWPNLFKQIFDLGIYSLMVEGGAQIHKSLIKNKLWDEARIITSAKKLDSGIKAPALSGKLMESYALFDDKIDIVNINTP